MLEADSVAEYLKLIYEFPAATMYRGQLDTSFTLMPSIARYSSYLKGYKSISAIEANLLSEFDKFVVPIKDLRSSSLIEKLTYAQHFGLPTRLLDWSTNPLKALYFAVENPSFDHKSGEVILFSPTSWYEGTTFNYEVSGIIAFYPELLNERIGVQEGCFTAFPLSDKNLNVPELNEENYPNDIEFISYIEIPGNFKQSIRRELNFLGINHRTIYPGAEGVAKWIKSNLANYEI